MRRRGSTRAGAASAPSVSPAGAVPLAHGAAEHSGLPCVGRGLAVGDSRREQHRLERIVDSRRERVTFGPGHGPPLEQLREGGVTPRHNATGPPLAPRG